jgi:Xaa-Pro aminopeptidase
MTAVSLSAQDAGVARLRPGQPAGGVAAAVRESAAEHGWELQGGRVGHGIGLDYSEREIPAESNESTLKAGMTIVVHSAFSLPGSGKLFVPLGDVCHLTGDGPELLMEFPRTPFVAGG